MSLYNTLHGIDPLVNELLKALNLDFNSIPRFRDIHLKDNGNKIIILARIGGNNKEDYSREFYAIHKHPQYIVDYDDSFDNTYCWIEYNTPKEYLDTFHQLFQHEPLTMKELSDKAIEEINKPGTNSYEFAQQFAKVINDPDNTGNRYFFI